MCEYLVCCSLLVLLLVVVKDGHGWIHIFFGAGSSEIKPIYANVDKLGRFNRRTKAEASSIIRRTFSK